MTVTSASMYSNVLDLMRVYFGYPPLKAPPPPIHSLSNELLFMITSYLDSASLVCFSLTSHRYSDFIRDRHKCRLDNICPKWSEIRNGRSPNECHKKLMKQLRSWMPERYIYCEHGRRCYVLKWVCDCADCERREKRKRDRAKNKREKEKHLREEEKHQEWKRGKARSRLLTRLFQLLLAVVLLVCGWVAGYVTARSQLDPPLQAG